MLTIKISAHKNGNEIKQHIDQKHFKAYKQAFVMI